MTVCIATLFQWNYAPVGEPPSYGSAAITISDRMMTAFDVQYEPPQQKVAILSPRTIVMVAGDIAVHSQAISKVAKQFGKDTSTTPENVALMYGREIQAVRQRFMEDQFLAPFGLNTDTFLAQQRDFSDGFVERIATQMQDYRGPEVEALVVGSDGENVGIYGIDQHGTVNLHNDIGFAAIGIGAWHAKSRLMQVAYGSGFTLAPALAATFASKKAAEVAPGVSASTDIHLVLRHSFSRIWPDVAAKVEAVYAEYERARLSLVEAGVHQLQAHLTPQNQEGSTEDAKKESARGRAQDHGGPGTSTAEAARTDEAKPPEGEANK